MKIAYLDCASGISGDMTLGAIVDAGVPLEAIQALVDSLGLPSCRLRAAEVKKLGFRALKIEVEHEPEHAHRHLHQITEMIHRSRLTPRQQELAERIFTRLGEAEARVHGTTLRKVHFHEVGAVDSIADIVGVAIGLDLLGVERIVASSVPTGHGTIEIAHGKCSIPAPATAELLRGVPLSECDIEAELTTPTGAAILASVVDSFGPLPSMRIEAIGCGAGSRELEERPNLLRLIVGTATEPAAEAAQGASDHAATDEEVWVVETSLDDSSGERIGFCTAELLRAGALDVYTTAIQMKKNRPGVLVTVLCRADERTALLEILFRETTTLGVRSWPASRRVLARRSHQVETLWGPIAGVVAWRGTSGVSFAPEYEACRQVATERGLPLGTVYDAAQRAFDPRAIESDAGTE